MSADIDIDLPDREKLMELIKHVPARQVNKDQSRKHNSGIYPTAVPTDPLLECCALDYREAEERGYFKIDLLNVNVYQLIKSPDHYLEMLGRSPPWHRLLDQSFCQQIIHVGNHYDLITKLKPDSIPRMAMFLAIIRPAKRYLADRSWTDIAKEVWVPPEDDSYFFKKSHAVGYAHLVSLHINLIDTA